MCFKNLPIEFDASGTARLKEGWANPFAFEPVPSLGYLEKLKAGGGGGGHGHEHGAGAPSLRDWSIDPVTRVAGALAVHTVLDLEKREAVEAHSLAMLFRGYEVILKGRDPRDAIDISSRACGVCGGVHSTVSSMAIEQAFGIVPPPLGVTVRNLGEVAEMFYDHPLHLGLLAGPDYSTAIVSVTNPELIPLAERTPAKHARIHGFATIKDLMDGFNPLQGRIYLEAIEQTRVARVMCTLMYGKYPHPSTLVPGGVSTTVSTTTFNEYYANLGRMFDYAKRLAMIWDDILDFFLEANPAYALVGDRPINLIQTGIWDDPTAYDATFQNCDAWGNRRYSSPGIIVDGRLVTTDLTRINMASRSSSPTPSTRTGRPTHEAGPLPARPPRQPALPVPHVEQGDDPAARGQELQGEVQLGHRAPLGPSLDGDGRVRPAVVDRPGGQPAGQPLHPGHR